MSTVIAFLIFRVVVAWFFLKPVKPLCLHWKSSLEMVKLISPYCVNILAFMMIAVMIIGSLSILFGFYAQIGAALLFMYSLMGVVVHTKLKNKILSEKLADDCSLQNRKIFDTIKSIGVVGHATSAEKNIVIAAALLIVVLLGSGPYSLTGIL